MLHTGDGLVATSAQVLAASGALARSTKAVLRTSLC